MKDQTHIMCPFKEAIVYQWVCDEKCKRDKGDCEAAREALHENSRYCVECMHFGVKEDYEICERCLNADPDHRTRPFWDRRPAIESDNEEKQAEDTNLEDFSLGFASRASAMPTVQASLF